MYRFSPLVQTHALGMSCAIGYMNAAASGSTIRKVRCSALVGRSASRISRRCAPTVNADCAKRCPIAIGARRPPGANQMKPVSTIMTVNVTPKTANA
jgi:hypothetical protein